MIIEAPDKIWINPLIDLPKLNGIIDKDSVQYIREDTFIKNAVIWISNNCYIPHSTLENFKKYIKGE